MNPLQRQLEEQRKYNAFEGTATGNRARNGYTSETGEMVKATRGH